MSKAAGERQDQAGGATVMTSSVHLVVFTIEEQQYGLNLSTVERVVRAVEASHLPKAPAIVLGVINVQVAAAHSMTELIDGLLALSRVARSEIRRERVNMSAVAEEVVSDLRRTQPGRQVDFVIAPELVAEGDTRLLRILLANLLGNAWKFTSKKTGARIELGVMPVIDGARVYFVSDDGAGCNQSYASKLFGAFQRMHSTADFEGTGIGLATVQRIAHQHGGRVWAEGVVDAGATFYFTLGSG